MEAWWVHLPSPLLPALLMLATRPRLAKLNAMRASDDLTEDQARQLQFETEQAYDEFHILLRG